MTKINSKTVIDITTDPGLIKNKVVPKKIQPPISIPKFHLKKDAVDKRDYLYRPTLTLAQIRDYVDLREYCTPIETQSNLGSCTGQAIAGAIEFLDKKAGKQVDISRLFIYYYERLIEGTINYDSGAAIRDGIKAVYHYGSSLENLWPYDIAKFKTEPTLTAINDAANRKVTLYQRVLDFNGCIDALNNGYPIIVGFVVYSSFLKITSNGIMQYPNKRRESVLGGHAVLIVGYDKRRQCFIVRNSWGSNWGDKGYFYMPFNVIKDTAMSWDFWIVKSVNNP